MARPRKPGASGGPSRRQRWEYEEEFFRHDAEWKETLDRYGARGFELVAMIHDESESDPLQVHAVFKRPVLDEDEVRPPPSEEADEEEG